MDSVFHRLYKEYQQDVFQFLIYLVKNRDTAEDLMQEVFIRVMKSYGNFEGKSSEKTWLFSIAKNVAIDHFRKQTTIKKRILETFDWNQRELVSKDTLPQEIVEQSEEIQELYSLLDRCKTDYKLVVVMRYIQELSIVETAEILGWTQGKVKTTQHRAIKHLRELMSHKRKEEEEDERFKMERSGD
ncbi:RNA polymerase sigma factor SigX [Jeotgalibacillus proteolyticus]|uniref:RNA polymerase sigma factor SigX n=1 Tax=Jeotgalibacillus proteolyticus TaxID=2082395 RepID=A0A2S5GEJ3_9BACL|nr:RNA polymerase sigma factor SigX [Jeotgalibacillus proteolyticus]PPA71293.1 RNA polymerase sigma factor SigX [Jeotgalibacillus proteolyticus]